MLVSDVIPMVQVSPSLIPSTGLMPYEFVPMNLPQMMVQRQAEQLVAMPQQAAQPVFINNSPSAQINIGSPYTGMRGLGEDMVQVRPTLIPSASSVPNEYVPVNLPQMMVENGKSFIREPAPSVNISPGGSINISSGGSFNVGSTLHPYNKPGMSGLDGAADIPIVAAVILGLIFIASKRG